MAEIFTSHFRQRANVQNYKELQKSNIKERKLLINKWADKLNSHLKKKKKKQKWPITLFNILAIREMRI